METIDGYAFRTYTELDFDSAIERITTLLKDNGFGILTEIDVKKTLKEKIDADWKPYRILGACNPPFAKKALEAEHLIGVLMPCNVVVWDEGEKRVVAAMNPNVMGKVIDKPEVQKVASEVADKLQKVIESF